MKAYEPISEIIFAAKYGFLTKGLWNDFFAQGSLGWKNKLWATFVKEQIFLPHYSKFAVHVLVPNKKHFLVQKVVGEELVLPPFISQLDHDERLARMVLSLLKDGIATNYRLEPELKRLGSGLQRHYGSSTKEKYPDALIQIANEKKTRIAIELELTRKDPKRYRQIMETYSSFKRADKIVFVVRDDRFSQTIKQAMRDSFYPDWERPVGFGRLEEWSEKASTAKISFADKTTNLSEIANEDKKE